MTHDEARRLLSGYATGSLTELERQLLFDAALADQELFDELAAEQALKELIELPGAKQRLLAALEPPPNKRSWWAQPWPWAAAAAIAAVSVAVWLMLPRTSVEPVQIAQNIEPAAVAVAPQTEGATQNAVPLAAPSPKTESPAPAAVEKSEAEIPAAPVRDEVRARVAAPPTAAAPEIQTQANDAAEAGVGPQIPAQSAKPALAFTDTIRINGQPLQMAAGTAGRVTGSVVPGGDALTYEVTDAGVLRIVPLRAGVLEVTAGMQILFASNPVVAGVAIELSIPVQAQQLRIDFTATANAPAVTAVRSLEPTGTIVLPTGANPRIVVEIPAKR